MQRYDASLHYMMIWSEITLILKKNAIPHDDGHVICLFLDVSMEYEALSEQRDFRLLIRVVVRDPIEMDIAADTKPQISLLHVIQLFDTMFSWNYQPYMPCLFSSNILRWERNTVQNFYPWKNFVTDIYLFQFETM